MMRSGMIALKRLQDDSITSDVSDQHSGMI